MSSMDYLDSFTAIDFETMTAARTSACAIGLVKVVSGQITQRFYSLIKPIPDDKKHDNTAVHGITREMVAKAPTFLELWPTITKIIGYDSLVAHNAEFDNNVWDCLLREYNIIDGPGNRPFLCTYGLTDLSLEDACKKHGIDMGHHHDALDDALACARVCLAELGIVVANPFKGSFKTVLAQSEAKKYDRDTLKPLEDSQIQNKNTPFFHAKTVITGVFANYPNRDDLGQQLKALGADINTTISKKTNIVVIGDGAGPAKLRKIQELSNQGCNIRLIFEPELVEILSSK